MRDSETGERIVVHNEGDAGPYILFPLDQLDDVRAVLDAAGLNYAVAEDAVAVGGEPLIATIDFGRRADPKPIQQILDAAGPGSLVGVDASPVPSARCGEAVVGFDRITVKPSVQGGQPCVNGTRLTVRRVLDLVATYPNRGELMAEYPELDCEAIGQCLRFAAAALPSRDAAQEAAA